MTPIIRPNGKLYRPRGNLRVEEWENDGLGAECGVMVFGTLDVTEARPFAEKAIRGRFGMDDALSPHADWLRMGYRSGEHCWVRDEVRGAPAVVFTAGYADEIPT